MTVTWITKESKSPMPPSERGPYLNAVLRVLLIPDLVIPNFYDMLHDVFTLFLVECHGL